MKRNILILTLFTFFITSGFAAEVKTIQVPSASMNKKVETVVVIPQDQSKAYPVIYLLHGYGGNQGTWIDIRPDLPRIADQYGIMFVCPFGQNSWYWDSPQDPSYRYETFISSELIDHIDTNYKTIRDRKGRAITGLSMGGHGALWNGFRHPDVFGAAGSTSGGVDIRPFPNNWDMSRQLGKRDENKSVWDNHTVINLVETLKNGEQAIIVDCGYADFFFDVNNALHAKLMEHRIDHDYIVRPGGHDGQYWNNSILYQILFFHTYFTRK